MTDKQSARPSDKGKSCPVCGKNMEFVRDVPMKSTWHGSGVSVPLDSSVYQCREHGQWQINILNQASPYAE